MIQDAVKTLEPDTTAIIQGQDGKLVTGHAKLGVLNQ
jgi:hypothetical protein